jgi:hypothetical protein
MHLARLLTLLAALLLCASSHAQTIKSLGYNTTNGFVVYGGTNPLTFTNAFVFTTNAKSQFITGIGFYQSTIDPLQTDADGLFDAANGETTFRIFDSEVFLRPEAAGSFRTNLGLSLPALTNTSNVTFLSAVGAAQTIFFVRTNDLSITNETNATSTGLSFNTEPNARYVVTLYPIVFGNTDVQMVASNSTIFGLWNGLGTGFASATELTNTRSFSAGSENRGALQTFYVEGGTNAGSISMTFRSATATNTNTIKAGSFLRADRMP